MPIDSTRPKKSLPRPVLKWLIIVLALILLVYLGTLPVRGKLAKDYTVSGDDLLVQKKYLSAELEYEKALTLNSKDQSAIAHRQTAQDAEADITKLLSLYKERGDKTKVALFAQAGEVPSNETEAVKLSKELIEKGEYQLAVIPAKTATEMDQGYRDAWLYLGIANLQVYQKVELREAVRGGYLSAAKAALEQAKTLDPIYQPTLDFLAEANK